MVFTYLNDQTVWGAFCDTYEAIHLVLGQFDIWYSDIEEPSGGIAVPSLQAEWKKYIETVLTSLVKRTRSSYHLYHNMAVL